MADGKIVKTEFGVDTSKAEQSMKEMDNTAKSLDKTIEDLTKKLDSLFARLDKKSGEFDKIFESKNAIKSLDELSRKYNTMVRDFKQMQEITSASSTVIGNFDSNTIKAIRDVLLKYKNQLKELRNEQKAQEVDSVVKGYTALSNKLQEVRGRMEEMLALEKSGQTTSGFAEQIKQYEKIIQSMGRVVYPKSELFDESNLQKFESYQMSLLEYSKQYKREVIEAKSASAKLLEEQRASQAVVEAQRVAEEQKAQAIERARDAYKARRDESAKTTETYTDERGKNITADVTKVMEAINRERQAVNDLQSKLIKVDSLVVKVGEGYARAFDSANVFGITDAETKLQRLSDILSKVKERSEKLKLGGADTTALDDSIARIETSILNVRERFRSLSDTALLNSLTTKFNELNDDVSKLGDKFDEIFKSGDLTGLTDASKEFNNLVRKSKQFKDELRNASTEGVNTSSLVESLKGVYERLRSLRSEAILAPLNQQINTLSGNVSSLGTRFQEIFKTGDFSGLKQANKDLQSCRDRAIELRNALDEARTRGVDTSGLEASLSSTEAELNSLVSSVSENFDSMMTDSVKHWQDSISKVLSVFGDGLKTVFNAGKTAATVYFNFLRSGFGSVVSYAKDKLKDIFTIDTSLVTKFTRALFPQASITGLAKLTKESVNLSASLFEIQNVVNNVFPESLDSINEFCEISAEKFGLTELAAKQMIGVFGGMLDASGIVGDAQAEMSKNLTALAGDVASFYNLDVSTVYKKLQSGLQGNVAAMRSFGVSMTVANLEAYALSKGIEKSYKSMSQAEKTTLRYNYMLSKLSTAQGDFARTSGSWANQIRMLSNNFKQLIGILGGSIIKQLYPAVKILNQIVVAAINAAGALAKLFGFDAEGLTKLYEDIGGSGGVQLPDTGDYESGMEGVADATDDAAKAQKKYNEELQSFDRLNNMTSSDKDKDSMTDLLGSGLLDFESYYKDIDKFSEKNPFIDWLNELYKALTDKDWHKAGEIVGTAIADLVDILDNKIVKNKAKTEEGISSFMQSIAMISDGILDVLEERKSFNTAGRVLGTLFDEWFTAIDEFYVQYHKFDIFERIGAQIAEFVNGFGDEIDWERAGRTLTTGFRIMLEGLHGFLFGSEFSEGVDFSGWGKHLHDLLLGAIDRAFGDGGAQIIGENISGLINGALTLAIETFGDGKVVNDFADGLVTSINTAIAGIDEKKLGQGLSTLLNNIGDLLLKLSDIDFSGLGSKLGEGLNDAVDSGSVSKFTSGLTSLFLSMVDGITSFAKTAPWGDLAKAVIDGISDGIKNEPDGAKTVAGALGVLFTAVVGEGLFKTAISLIGLKIISGLAGNLIGVGGGTGAGVGTLAKGAASVGVYIGASIVGSLLGYGAGGWIVSKIADNWLEGYEDYVQDLTSVDLDPNNFHQQTTLALKEEQAQLSDTILSFENFFDYVGKEQARITEGEGIFGGGLADDIQDYYDISALMTYVDNYISALEEMGYANNEYVISARNYIEQGKKAITETGMSEAIVAALAPLGELQLQLNTNAIALVETGEKVDGIVYKVVDGAVRMSSEFGGAIDRIVEDTSAVGEEIIIGLATGIEGSDELLLSASGNIYSAVTGELIKLPPEMEGIAFDSIERFSKTLNSDGSLANIGQSLGEFVAGTKKYADMSEVGQTAGKSFVDGAFETIASDETIGQAVESSIATSTESGVVKASEAGVATGEAFTTSEAEAIRSDEQTGIALDDLGESNKQRVILKSTEVGIAMAETMSASASVSIASDTSVGSSVESKVAEAGSVGVTTGQSAGKGVGEAITSAASATVSSSNTLQSSVSNSVNSATSAAKSTASSGGKDVGNNIMSGVKSGMEGGQGGVFSFIGNFVNNLINKFKDTLGIHSPSKVFMDASKFIPSGVAVGIEEGADQAYSEINKFSDNLISQFESETINMDSVIDTSKFGNLFNSMYSETDDFVSRMNELLSGIGIGDIDVGEMQAKVLQSPRGRASAMSAQFESSRNLQEQQMLSNIMSSLQRSGINSSSGQKMSVNVYLDATTRLGQFVIDTMSGQVIKTGGF